MPVTHDKKITLPAAGDDLLGAWKALADSLGVIVPVASLVEAQVVASNFVAAGGVISASKPLYFDVGNILYAARGSKASDGSYVISPIQTISASAFLTWSEARMADLPSSANNAYGYVPCSQADEAVIDGGMRINGQWLHVPVSGIYQVNVTTFFRWVTTASEWMVGAYVRRQSKPTPQDRVDPSDTQWLLPGVTTTPNAMGIMRLAAGEGIQPSWWQKTNDAWKPERISMSVQLLRAS